MLLPHLWPWVAALPGPGSHRGCPWLSSAWAPALALPLASLGGRPPPLLNCAQRALRPGSMAWAPPGAPLGPGHRHQGQTRAVSSGLVPSLFSACPCRQLRATDPPPTSLRGLCLPGVTAGLSQVLLPGPAFGRSCRPPGLVQQAPVGAGVPRVLPEKAAAPSGHVGLWPGLSISSRDSLDPWEAQEMRSCPFRFHLAGRGALAWRATRAVHPWVPTGPCVLAPGARRPPCIDPG